MVVEGGFGEELALDGVVLILRQSCFVEGVWMRIISVVVRHETTHFVKAVCLNDCELRHDGLLLCRTV